MKVLQRRLLPMMLVLASVLVFSAKPALADENCSHVWSDWQVSYEPTCGEPGEKYRECSLCLTQEWSEIPATGDHEWGDWEVEVRATVNRIGSKYRECEDCGATQTAVIAKLKPYAKFKKKTYSITKGKSESFRSKIKMAKGDAVKKWKSSNTKVLTVSKTGKVKAKRTGTATVTAVLKSGKKAKCKVKVKAPARKSSKKKSSGGGSGTVYWTPGGSVYHRTSSCSTLSRSRVINSGPLSSCPKSRPCKVCY